MIAAALQIVQTLRLFPYFWTLTEKEISTEYRRTKMLYFLRTSLWLSDREDTKNSVNRKLLTFV